MKRKLFFFRAMVALCLALCLAAPVFADGTDEAYTGALEEFAQLEGLQGVFVTGIPDADEAKVLLGAREIRRGDVLTADELRYLSLQPAGEWEGEAEICFLPVCGGVLGDETVLTMHVQREKAPAAPDQTLEIWRGIPGSGTLRATGEGRLSFRLLDAPAKGTVELDADGAFTYTPKGQLVGEDSFSFTVIDEAGRESEPARVLVTIRKPTDSRSFADLDRDRQFTALWLRQTGVYEGGEEDGRLCFYPERSVSRIEFLSELMELTGITPELGLSPAAFADESDTPAEQRPYLAAALRRGLVRGYDSEEGPIFLPNQPIKSSEAARMVARVLEELGCADAAKAAEKDAAAACPDCGASVPAWAGAAASAPAARLRFPGQCWSSRG